MQFVKLIEDEVKRLGGRVVAVATFPTASGGQEAVVLADRLDSVPITWGRFATWRTHVSQDGRTFGGVYWGNYYPYWGNYYPDEAAAVLAYADRVAEVATRHVGGRTVPSSI